MTTDAAVAEPEVIQTEAPTTEEAPSTIVDAVASTPADAGTEPTQTEPQSVDDYVAAQLQKGSEQAKPEDAAVEPQVDYEAIRMADEARTRYQGNHKVRHDAIDTEFDATVDRLVEDGYTRVVAHALLDQARKNAHDKLNEHHADSLRDAGYASSYEQNQAMWRGVAAVVPAQYHNEFAQKLEQGKYTSHEVVFQDVWAKAEAEGAAKADKAGYERGLRQGFKDGQSQTAKLSEYASDGQQVNGTGTGGTTYSLAQWNALGLEGREAARRKDPDIEMKIR